MKKIIKYSLSVLLALLVAILLLPVLFKGELIKELKKQINARINAELDFRDVNVSLIKSFPDVHLEMMLLTINGVEEFEGINLLKTDVLEFNTNLKSLIQPAKGITIKYLGLENAQLNILVREDSTTNYNILKDDGSADNSSYAGEIDSYKINNGRITYSDLTADMSFVLDSIDHSGKGDFSAGTFDLSTVSSIADIDLVYAGIPYIRNMRANAEMIISIDLNDNSYRIKDNKTSLNSLDLDLEGGFQILPDSYIMDIQARTKEARVDDIIAVLPGLYEEMLMEYNSSGNGMIAADISGTLDLNKGIYPKIDVKALIENGRLSYVQSEWPMEDINADLRIAAAEGDWSDLNIDMKNLNFRLGQHPFSSRLSAKNVLGNTQYTGQIFGKIDFAYLDGFIKNSPVAFDSGIMDIDLSLDASKSSIINKLYNNILLKGRIDLRKLAAKKNNTVYNLEEMNVDFSPSVVTLDFEDGRIGNSDLSARIQLRNPLALLEDASQASLIVDGKSRKIDWNELKQLMVSEVSDTTGANQLNTSGATSVSGLPDTRFNISASEIAMEEYKLNDLILRSNYSRDRLEIQEAKLKLDGEELSLKGNIRNLESYMMDNDTLKGELFVNANRFVLDNFVAESNDTNQSKATGPIEIPGNLRISVIAELGTLVYNKLKVGSFTGKLNIEDKALVLTNTNGTLLGGRMALEGKYDTGSPDQPVFDFKYDLANLPFAEFFSVSPLFRKLNPLAEFVDGAFNSTLVLSGPIGKDMMPVFSRLTASGFFETLKTRITGWPAMDKLKNKLGIEGIKEWYIRDSRNWFEIKDGVLDIKPYELQVNTFACKAGGTISLDKTVALNIETSIPRSILDHTGPGAEINKGLSQLQSQAEKAGIDIGIGENIYLSIALNGPLDNPDIAFRPTGSGGKKLDELVGNRIQEEKDKLKDSIQTKVQEKKEMVKDTLAKVRQEAKDTLRSKTTRIVEEVGQEVKDKVGARIDSSINNILKDSTGVGAKIKDAVKNTTGSEIDSIKSKITNWNPFGKKKN